MARRLPVYLLIDTSGSMKGEPIESVKVGIETMLNTLRKDPYALETVNISIITYDRDVKQFLPIIRAYLEASPYEEIHMGTHFNEAIIGMKIQKKRDLK